MSLFQNQSELYLMNSPKFFEKPYPIYHRTRQNDPVYWSQSLGEQPPGTTAAQHVENGIDDVVTGYSPRSTPSARRWQQLAKDLSLLVGQVHGIDRLFRVGHRYDSFRSLLGIESESYRF